MSSREQPSRRLWPIGTDMNIQDRVRDPRIQQHLNQVMRGVIPGAAPRHEYHPNPYLEHLYHNRDRSDDGAGIRVDGAGPGAGLGAGQGVGLGAQRAQEHIINLEDLDAQLSEVLQIRAPQDQGQVGENGSSHTHSHGGRPARQVQGVGREDWKMALISVSFAVILFLRLMVDHILGLLVFLALSLVFHYANMKMIEIVHITSLRDHQNRMRTIMSSMWLVVFLSANILCIYWFFEDQHLWRVLYFDLPTDWQGSVFSLFWVTMVTDHVLRYGMITLKALISMIPNFCILQKRKGKYYMFVERVGHLYRSAVPVLPWMHFLYDQPRSGKLIFAAILVVVYLVLKSWLFYMDSFKLQKAIKALRTDNKYGVQPSEEEVKSRGENCPICQEDYQDPVMLTCKHIFCENCVSIWFDREKTCPMCRAQIQDDSPEWQDGSTSSHLQWY